MELAKVWLSWDISTSCENGCRDKLKVWLADRSNGVRLSKRDPYIASFRMLHFIFDEEIGCLRKLRRSIRRQIGNRTCDCQSNVYAVCEIPISRYFSEVEKGKIINRKKKEES